MQSQQTLELRQRQQLAMTPALQQSIRFLQLSTLELRQELAQAVLDNPMLESEAEYDTDEGAAIEANAWTADWTPGMRGRARADDDIDEGMQVAVPESLQDYLLRQLNVARVGSRDDALVRVLVHELNADGYLDTSVSDILAFLRCHVPVDDADVRSALAVLQTFDPPGIGALDLRDCLLLQLDRLAAGRSGDALRRDVLDCARTVVREHLDLLASGNLARVRRAAACDTALFNAAHALILSLEPRPARDWAPDVAAYIIPDVIVRRTGSRWRAILNTASMPRVRVHTLYSDLLQSLPGAGELRAQLQRAQGLIKGLEHRADTLSRVSQAIVDRQQDYFELGMQGMRPLILRDIAQQLDLHESTVSRATRFKYAQTPHGVIELRRFFGTTLDTADGESTSASAVQALIAQLVAGEPPGKPLSDQRITQALERMGVKIARRTVAKYREHAGIEPAIRRKARYSVRS